MRIVQIVGLLTGIALASGACSTDSAHRATTPWPAYVGLMFVVGVLWVLGEVVVGSVLKKDKTSDPLPRRVGRLALALIVCVAIAGLMSWLLGPL